MHEMRVGHGRGLLLGERAGGGGGGGAARARGMRRAWVGETERDREIGSGKGLGETERKSEEGWWER